MSNPLPHTRTRISRLRGEIGVLMLAGGFLTRDVAEVFGQCWQATDIQIRKARGRGFNSQNAKEHTTPRNEA